MQHQENPRTDQTSDDKHGIKSTQAETLTYFWKDKTKYSKRQKITIILKITIFVNINIFFLILELNYIIMLCPRSVCSMLRAWLCTLEGHRVTFTWYGWNISISIKFSFPNYLEKNSNSIMIKQIQKYQNKLAEPCIYL